MTEIKGLSIKELRYIEKWVVGNMIVGVVGGLGLAIFIVSLTPEAER